MKLLKTFSVLGALALCVLWTAPASAQATRTWVSGVGNDANPCSRTAPCKTWAGAISKTAAGGEIDALDPGGFGAVTITKSITLDGGGGQVASVLVSGTNGIVVQGSATDVVILRNLMINGIRETGSPGLNGVRWTAGLQLRLEHDYIFGFSQTCIDDESNTAGSQMVVVDTRVIDCAGNGVLVHGAGNVVAKASLNNVVSSQSGVGLQANDGSRVFISNCEFSLNASQGVLLSTSAAAAFLAIDHSKVSGNGTNGLQTSGPIGQQTIVMSDTDLMGNLGASLTGSNISSYGNNHINNNVTNNAPTGSPIAPQ